MFNFIKKKNSTNSHENSKDILKRSIPSNRQNFNMHDNYRVDAFCKNCALAISPGGQGSYENVWYHQSNRSMFCKNTCEYNSQYQNYAKPDEDTIEAISRLHHAPEHEYVSAGSIGDIRLSGCTCGIFGSVKYIANHLNGEDKYNYTLDKQIHICL